MSMTTTAEFETAETIASEPRQPALPLRGDTILGVCEAIGQDLGFNPNFLRIPFAALLLWNPVVIVGTYLALGGVVALSRWFFPAEQRTSVGAASDTSVSANEVGEEAEERLAA